ncbi:hypothetical protein T459_28806 [Capsicum annuum]|uniref:FF domain-containing protein n=1 Tax=Capsicum annuum TaxID=4072 RepID=A0A2G2YHY4_CAPAN|nr:hypothetical protein T459_28806 [Capsicum annuum]
MIVVIVEIAGTVVTIMILRFGSGGGGCDVKLVNVSSWSCDGGMVVSIDTVASVADGGGRGGDASDNVLHKMSGLSAKALVVLPCYVSLEVGQFVIAKLFVFEELLERARETEEKEAKKRKRLADEFYELIHASKEITTSSKWEDCKSLFGDRQVASFAFIDLELVT